MNNVLSTFMGDEFYQLAPLLQRAHQGHILLQGSAKVQRGNWAAKIICYLLGFPKQNTQAQLSVECQHFSDKMTWQRSFDGDIMRSTFTQKNHYLVERLGLVDVYLQPRQVNGELHYHHQRTDFCGIRLPALLSPKTQSREYEKNGHYCFEVTASLWGIGLVVAYKGRLEVQQITEAIT